MPRRTALLRKVLKGAVPPQAVKAPVVVKRSAPQKKQYDPALCDPAKFSLYSQKLYRRVTQSIKEGRPHFLIGGNEVYFPWSPVTLLKPSARMTPFQAQFQVPRSFSKLDLRDYLWNLYDLRALRITTQIKWSQWTRSRGSRFRTPQKKKMIIDMESPFVWPAEDKEALKSHSVYYGIALDKYPAEMQMKQGSDLKKPAEAFDGILGPYPDPPQGFLPRKVKQRLVNTTKRAAALASRQNKLDLISRFASL